MENFHSNLDSSVYDPGCLHQVETPLWQQGAREPGGRSVSMGTVGRGPRCIIRSVEGHDLLLLRLLGHNELNCPVFRSASHYRAATCLWSLSWGRGYQGGCMTALQVP
jgi:hypothetical protein